MHEEYNLVSRNVVGKLYYCYECVSLCRVVARSVKGIVPEGEGDAALLVRQEELQKNRYRPQLNALARDFLEEAIVSPEHLEDAKLILRSWIDRQKKPLIDIKADNGTGQPNKAQKRRPSEMATSGKKKRKKKGSESQASDAQPSPHSASQVYLTSLFSPLFCPLFPQSASCTPTVL